MTKANPPADRGGCFISLEGIEGTGKTTLARVLAERLKTEGLEAILTQEPGGTLIGSRIREILLNPEHKEISFMTELLLYNADRSQHLSQKILPALRSGSVVITDRYSDSTIAYQGYGRGLDLSLISSLDRIATSGLKPDLTLLLDLDSATGLCRNRAAGKTDRLELETIEFHGRVRKGFRELANKEPDRIKTVDASMPLERVHEEAWAIVSSTLRGMGLIRD